MATQSESVLLFGRLAPAWLGPQPNGRSEPGLC